MRTFEVNCSKQYKVYYEKGLINRIKELLFNTFNGHNILIITDDNVDPRLEKISILVKKLPEKYRRVVVLHYYDSMPIKEISKALNISDSAIKKRLERARNILKEGMDE